MEIKLWGSMRWWKWTKCNLNNRGRPLSQTFIEIYAFKVLNGTSHNYFSITRLDYNISIFINIENEMMNDDQKALCGFWLLYMILAAPRGFSALVAVTEIVIITISIDKNLFSFLKNVCTKFHQNGFSHFGIVRG